MFKQSRRVDGRPYIPKHPPMLGHVESKGRVKIQVVIERDGKRYEIEVPLTASDIARLGLEALMQNRTMPKLLTQAVRSAIKKNLIEEFTSRSQSRDRTLTMAAPT